MKKVIVNLLLEELYLDNNLSGSKFPKEIGKLEIFTRVVFNNNNLSGSIPKEIGKLENLQVLYLQNNQ